MPVRAVVLALHVRSSRALWGAERQLAWHPTHPQVSSVSRRRVRSGTLGLCVDKRNLLIALVLLMIVALAPSLLWPTKKPAGGRGGRPRRRPHPADAAPPRRAPTPRPPH